MIDNWMGLRHMVNGSNIRLAQEIIITKRSTSSDGERRIEHEILSHWRIIPCREFERIGLRQVPIRGILERYLLNGGCKCIKRKQRICCRGNRTLSIHIETEIISMEQWSRTMIPSRRTLEIKETTRRTRLIAVVRRIRWWIGVRCLLLL